MQPKRINGYEVSKSEHFKATVLDDMDIEAGPTLSVKKRQLVEQFIGKMGGKRIIQRILIANNGMAATKAILSMRQWAYTVLGIIKLSLHVFKFKAVIYLVFRR